MNEMVTMSREELRQHIQSAVQAEIEQRDSSREAAEAHKEIQTALAEAREVFVNLKTAIAARDEKIAEYEQALANLDMDPTSVEVSTNKRLVELEAALEAANQRVSVAEAALDTIAREETAGTRMEELTELELSLEGEDSQVQYRKVRAMSDEDFEGYKRELLAMKAKFAVQSASDSDTEQDSDSEAAELSDEEIKEIAERLGCDPKDESCISTVREVAHTVNSIKARSINKDASAERAEKEDGDSQFKETASQKGNFSIGEVLSLIVDGKAPAVTTLRDRLTAAWTETDENK